MEKATKSQSRASSINLLGGALCLDFANTVDWRTTDRPEEILGSYRELVDWSRHVGTIDDHRAARLKHRAALHPGEARMKLEQAIELREAVYQVFAAIARDKLPARSQLQRLNRSLSPVLSRSAILRARNGFDWGWGGDPAAFDSILWPVAWSAARLLTSPEVGLVRECLGPGCGWLFLDRSRTHRRQWCDMKGCGNRAKARRYYERQKANK